VTVAMSYISERLRGGGSEEWTESMIERPNGGAHRGVAAAAATLHPKPTMSGTVQWSVVL
jgi:hypothetical protein